MDSKFDVVFGGGASRIRRRKQVPASLPLQGPLALLSFHLTLPPDHHEVGNFAPPPSMLFIHYVTAAVDPDSMD